MVAIDEDIKYLKLAIECSRKSMEAGNFPAGAVVVKDGKILSSEVSSPYPGLFHADSKAIATAFKSSGPLGGGSLYIGLESCMMCLGVAYWAGIRRIVFAVPKTHVSSNYYESSQDISNLISKFNEPIKLIHAVELEKEALSVIREWEKKLQH